MSVTDLDRAASNHQAILAKKVVPPDVLPTPLVPPALRSSPKIRDRHRDRLAVVYVRQSSPHQVLENRESRERQYGLAMLAQQFGWPGTRKARHFKIARKLCDAWWIASSCMLNRRANMRT